MQFSKLFEDDLRFKILNVNLKNNKSGEKNDLIPMCLYQCYFPKNINFAICSRGQCLTVKIF